MGLFAALMTYLVAATLLVGGMVTGLTVFLSQPSDSVAAEKPRPPLIRAAERKAAESPNTAAPPQSATAASPEPAVNPVSADSARLTNAQRARQAAGLPVRKKKIVKSAPPPREPETAPEPDTATLGYGPDASTPRRKFIFPLDPDW